MLLRAGITRAELARRLGLSKGTVSRWGGMCPKYAEAYVLLLIEFNRVRP